jgi:hypothetical protein
MKKALFTSIIGLAAAVSSYGQGSVFFSTYTGTVYQPIKYAAPLPSGTAAGQTIGSGFTAQLYYGLGSGLAFSALSPLSGATQAVGTQLAGYVTGGIVTIPGYSSGPVTFAIVAYNGTDWGTTLASASGIATLLGNVATWTEPSIAASPNPAGLFGNVPAITVSAVPEPTTMALAGLGSLALLAVRRRK